ncbi:hypothetical protein O4_63 [Pseudomonas phage O4]|uniref:hypothetical protein n=1 Tax=Pseudomonas phage O4 TaxID=1784982 RepID=UPI00078D106C|nr:hypothetical protein BJD45_gp63 [Pseudomonas phage O4]AMO43538.1 hypothetical protein O4_63 [Pseudomonas phage O4]
MIALILLFIIGLLVYMAVSLLVAGIASLNMEQTSQKDEDISIILGVLWPVSLPYMCFMTVIYYPLVATIKAAKRLIKGDY